MEKTDNRSSLAIAQEYHLKWTSGLYDEAAKLLDESVQFDMPINEYKTKKAFMGAVEFTGNNATDINLLSELGGDNEAVLIYDFNFSQIGNLRIVEHFKTRNGKIIFVRHIHDTFKLRNTQNS